MSNGRDRWFQRRRQAQAALPVPVILSCAVRQRGDGAYAVTIRGSGLLPYATPPTIRVGGQELRQVRLDEGGRITGILDQVPQGTALEVDLGPVRARGTITELRPRAHLPTWLRRTLAGVTRRLRR